MKIVIAIIRKYQNRYRSYQNQQYKNYRIVASSICNIRKHNGIFVYRESQRQQKKKRFETLNERWTELMNTFSTEGKRKIIFHPNIRNTNFNEKFETQKVPNFTQ